MCGVGCLQRGRDAIATNKRMNATCGCDQRKGRGKERKREDREKEKVEEEWKNGHEDDGGKGEGGKGKHEREEGGRKSFHAVTCLQSESVRRTRASELRRVGDVPQRGSDGKRNVRVWERRMHVDAMTTRWLAGDGAMQVMSKHESENAAKKRQWERYITHLMLSSG